MSTAYAARFKLFVMCANCMRNSAKVICVPIADDAPTSVDELTDSAFLQAVRYDCRGCESTIAEIVGIDELPIEDEQLEDERIAA